MLGLILLLILKVCSSNAVDAITGTTATLTCAVQGTSYIWQKQANSGWFTPQNGAKYDNVNTALLTIYNVELNDGGYYQCAVGLLSEYVYLTVKVNGNWGQWGPWSACSKTCGGGTRKRYKPCNNPAPANGGSYCSGLNYETTPCSTSQCPGNENWGAWGSWNPCTVTCGGGTRTRYRSCNGSSCSGLSYETTSCSIAQCPLNGNWGTWGDWTQCTKTCGGGTRTRYRACDNPSPVNGSSSCLGLENEIRSCSTTIPCPVNGNWGSWGDWTQCTKTFVGGTRTRHRTCDNPSPANGGSPCQGLENEIGSCSTTIPCPVNGNWGTWQDWNSCSLTCGIGSRSRYQECNNPEPAHGGSECQGNDTEIESCSIMLCSVASEEDNSSTTIGIGAGIGSTAVVAGLFIIFIYILKRYRLGQSVESAIYATARDTGSSNSDLHIYTGLQHNTELPTIRQKEVIYVNMVI